MPRCDGAVRSQAAVDELSAQLDRHRSGTVSSSDAPLYALARFDNTDIETDIVQYAPPQ